MKLNLQYYSFVFAAFLLTGEAVAQQTAVPPYDPTQPYQQPYGQQAPGFAPIPGNPINQAPGTVPPGSTQSPQGGNSPGSGGNANPYGNSYDEDSYFVPVDPPGGFDYFADDEGDYAPGGSSYSSGYDRGKREVKDSFKLLSEPESKQCTEWRHKLLGPSTFRDKMTCQFELDRKVNEGLASIDDVYDKIEFFKLKKVIKKQLKNRAEANKYAVSFDSLRGALQNASREGCECET